jgi:hypothetical protein
MSANTETHLKPRPRRRLHVVIALFAIVIAAVALAACGSSSGGSSGSGSGTTTSASSSAGTSTAPGAHGAGGAFGARSAALRECIKKNGVNLPSANTGHKPGEGFLGNRKLSTSEREKLMAALKKCGGRGFPGGARFGFSSATAKAALTKYAACMRENGVNLPTPNTNGNGPVFDTKGIDTSSESFKNAQAKCRTDLKGAFGGGRPPGGGGGGGQPPAGGEGGPPAGARYGGPPPGSEAEGG